jgi:hypothetical protein
MTPDLERPATDEEAGVTRRVRRRVIGTAADRDSRQCRERRHVVLCSEDLHQDRRAGVGHPAPIVAHRVGQPVPGQRPAAVGDRRTGRPRRRNQVGHGADVDRSGPAVRVAGRVGAGVGRSAGPVADGLRSSVRRAGTVPDAGPPSGTVAGTGLGIAGTTADGR